MGSLGPFTESGTATLITINYILTSGLYTTGDYAFSNIASFETTDNHEMGSDPWTVNIHVPGSLAAFPEPTTMLLFDSGLLGLWRARRRFKK